MLLTGPESDLCQALFITHWLPHVVETLLMRWLWLMIMLTEICLPKIGKSVQRSQSHHSVLGWMKTVWQFANQWLIRSWLHYDRVQNKWLSRAICKRYWYRNLQTRIDQVLTICANVQHRGNPVWLFANKVFLRLKMIQSFWPNSQVLQF